MDGQGTLTGSNGERYVGEFKDGKANGQGTFTLTNGDEIHGGIHGWKSQWPGHQNFSDG